MPLRRWSEGQGEAIRAASSLHSRGTFTRACAGCGTASPATNTTTSAAAAQPRATRRYGRQIVTLMVWAAGAASSARALTRTGSTAEL